MFKSKDRICPYTATFIFTKPDDATGDFHRYLLHSCEDYLIKDEKVFWLNSEGSACLSGEADRHGLYRVKKSRSWEQEKFIPVKRETLMEYVKASHVDVKFTRRAKNFAADLFPMCE